MVAFDQGTHRAYVDTSPTELAARLQEGRAKGRTHQSLSAAFSHRNGIVTAQFFTGADTPGTDDAQVVIAVVEWVGHFQGNLPIFVLQWRFQFHTQVTNSVFQFAAFVLGAGYASVIDRNVTQADISGTAYVNPVASETAARVLSNEHFHNRLAQVVNLGGLGLDFHAISHRQCAGGWEAPLAFHADHAHAAGAVGLHPRVIAQVWDVDSGINGCFQYHLAWLSLDLFTIKCDCDFIGHSAASISRQPGFRP